MVTLLVVPSSFGVVNTCDHLTRFKSLFSYKVQPLDGEGQEMMTLFVPVRAMDTHGRSGA